MIQHCVWHALASEYGVNREVEHEDSPTFERSGNEGRGVGKLEELFSLYAKLFHAR